MANTNAPFGFSPEGVTTGSTPNFRLSARLIASTNATAIFRGDVVQAAQNPDTGYIIQGTASTQQIVGVFWGCKYLSTSRGCTVWSPYWPGSDATGDVQAAIISDPNASFVVQAGATAIGLSKLNLNVALNVGMGNTITGLSGMFIENPAATSTLPFIITGFVQSPAGVNGTDITTPYNWVVVAFNNQFLHAPQTSITA